MRDPVEAAVAERRRVGHQRGHRVLVVARSGYAAELRKLDADGLLDQLSMDYLVDSGAVTCGTPDDCVEAIRRYQEAGVDTLLCLVNPYKIPHDAVMRTIELMGTQVLPHFR